MFNVRLVMLRRVPIGPATCRGRLPAKLENNARGEGADGDGEGLAGDGDGRAGEGLGVDGDGDGFAGGGDARAGEGLGTDGETGIGASRKSMPLTTVGSVLHVMNRKQLTPL